MGFNGGSADNLAELESDRKSAEFFAKNLQNGFAYCKVVTDKNGKPVDYVYVYVNDAYIDITGSKREVVLGKRAVELFPTLVNDPADWISKYGKVAMTGKPVRFEALLQFRNVYYSLFVYSPRKGYFAVIFDDVTSRKKAEHALECSNQKTIQILESIKDYFYSLDRDWNFIYVNKQAATLLGKDPEELVGNNIWKIFPKGLGTAFEENYRATMKNRETRRFETRGGPYANAWLMVTVFPSDDGISALAVDITELKKVEEALANSNEKITEIVESIRDSFYVLDRNWNFVYANKKTSDFVGIEPEECIGKNFWKIFPKHVGTPLAVNLRGAMENREFRKFEMPGRYADAWFEVTIYPSTEGITVLATNSTERKRAEATLQQSEQRWSTTLSSIGDAVIATDTKGKINFMNKVAEEITGWVMPDALQKPINEVFKIINEHTRADVENPVEKVLEKGMIVGLANHTVLIRKDCSEVPIDDSGAPIKDKDGKTTGVVLIFRDITERKKTETSLKEIKDQLELQIKRMPIGCIVWDKDFKVISWNPAAETIFGYSAKETIGKHPYGMIVPKERSVNRRRNLGAVA